MRLRVLNVAYPLAPVAPDAVGGAEQILSQVDAALVRAGHQSLVIACEGSRVDGTLLPVARHAGPLTEDVMTAARARHRRAIMATLARVPVDVVHMHGIDFHTYLPPAGVPVLATLHLPVRWYPPGALAPTRPETFLHCVSARQHAECPAGPQLLPPIENGVDVDGFTARRKRGFALMLARICPEKGVHLALDAARQAGVPLVVAGEVFPYPAHRDYFENQVRPRLDRARRFIGPVAGARKRRLLATARCVLVPSLVPETSGLVAREALAAGTPVIAFARGAMPDTIEHGRTGFLVGDADEMAHAITRASEIDPEACREAARVRFPLARMTDDYLATYARLARRTAASSAA